MATATLTDKAVWRREGFRSVAAWMAAQTGTGVGPATESLEMADLLAELPVLADAFRSGRLSKAQAVEIADVAAEAPEVQEQLVERPGKLSLRGLREECRRVKASVIVDEDDRYRRVHQSRRIRSWVDKDGVGRMTARMTPDDLARVMAEVDRRCNDTVVDAIRGGWFESHEAHRVDALEDLARPDSAALAGPERDPRPGRL